MFPSFVMRLIHRKKGSSGLSYRAASHAVVLSAASLPLMRKQKPRSRVCDWQRGLTLVNPPQFRVSNWEFAAGLHPYDDGMMAAGQKSAT